MKPPSALDLKLIRMTAAEYALKRLSAFCAFFSFQGQRVFAAICIEIAKIHRRQNHAKLVTDTFISNAAGLLMGMLSAQFVSRFFDVKGLHNLWGITSRQTLVSENTYNGICFAVEFFVALVVFTLTDHFINEYRSRHRSLDPARSDPMTPD